MVKGENRRKERQPSYYLVGLDDKSRPLRLLISAPVLVGRGAYNHVILNDDRISRHHSKIATENGACVVYDLNSVNGTFVNDVPVRRQRLHADDTVRFGPYSFRIECEHAGTLSSDDDSLDVETPTLSGVERYSEIVGYVEARDSAPSLPAVNLTQLEDANKKLVTVYSFMQSISKTLDTRQLVELIGRKVRSAYPTASSVGIYLTGYQNDGSDELRLAHHSGSGPITMPPVLPDYIFRAAIEAGRAILTTTAPGSNDAGNSMYAPMFDRGEALGVIRVDVDEGAGAFNKGDLDLLNGMAAPVAIMLQNARMHHESLRQDRLRYDLELAAQIQRSFLPKEIVSVDGIEFLAEYKAAFSIGGDFYDVLWVGPDRIAVYIGDVSGKGVSAALLMARISNELRFAALAHVEPVQVLTVINGAAVSRDHPDLFFTAIYLVLDVKTREIVLANAGHPPPYLLHADGSFEAITAGASGAVGIFEHTEFAQTRFRLAPGDSLLLYTDGIIEATDTRGRLFGSGGLEACLAEGVASPSQLADRILRRVGQHAETDVQVDDLTFVICRHALGTEARTVTDPPPPLPGASTDRGLVVDSGTDA